MQRAGITTAKLATIVTIVAIFAIAQRSATSAQRRPNRRRPAAQTAKKSLRDYSVFKHEDHRKEANGKELPCSSCHIITSPAQPDRINASTKPASNSSYPYHDSCFRCHREQVYRGDKPQICTVCHTRVSPRTAASDLYSQFPNPRRGDVIAREFPGYYPHGLHESVFASNRPRESDRVLFVKAAFTQPAAQTSRDVCAACHSTDNRGVLPLPSEAQKDETFKQIEPDTFRTIPGYHAANGHATCFNCHWQAQKPTRDDCNGCHLSETDYKARALNIIRPPALSAKALQWFKEWPKDVPKRFSLKFRHNTHTLSEDGKSEVNNHDLGCTTCHANIAQMTTLNIPKADVPITACGPCHSATSAIPVARGIRVTIFDEMTQKQDAAKRYTCVACHTSVIGQEQPPCSHYAIIGQTCSQSPRVAGR